MALDKVVSDFSDASTDGSANYFKVREASPYRIGRIIQNQNGAGNFWVCNRNPSRDQQALKIPPGFQVMEDILPPQDELFIRCDTAGIFLTIVEKFVSGGG